MSKERWARAMVPLLLGHVLAYPVAFAWALAWIPLALWVLEARIVDMDEAAASALVLRHVLWPAAAVFACEHVAAVPWAFARNTARGRRLFVGITCALGGIAIVLGGALWGRLIFL